MTHGVVEVVAYQETLLAMAVFGIAILAMIWVGFRRWLQHKDRMGRLIGEQTAEHAAEFGAYVERVEARLSAIEQIVADGVAPTAAQFGAPDTKPLADPNPREATKSSSG